MTVFDINAANKFVFINTDPDSLSLIVDQYTSCKDTWLFYQ